MNTGVTSIIFELAAGKFVLTINALIKIAMSQENIISLRVKRSRHQTCKFKHHGVSGRSMISWLLMLIMVTGPFQASFAMHSNSNTPDRETQALAAQFQQAGGDSEQHHCIAEYCQPLSACAAHFTCTPMDLNSTPQLSVQAQFYHHDLIADVAVSTRFPGLLKRPPRS